MRLRRGLAIFALVVLGVGQLLGFDHLATARHARCSEHGELVDAGRAPRPARAASLSPVDGVAGGHDHCSITAFLHQAAAGGPRAAALPAPPAAPPALPAFALLPAPRALLYRLAPKTSPPV